MLEIGVDSEEKLIEALAEATKSSGVGAIAERQVHPKSGDVRYLVWLEGAKLDGDPQVIIYILPGLEKRVAAKDLN